jgi:hypothetical protein
MNTKIINLNEKMKNGENVIEDLKVLILNIETFDDILIKYTIDSFNEIVRTMKNPNIIFTDPSNFIQKHNLLIKALLIHTSNLSVYLIDAFRNNNYPLVKMLMDTGVKFEMCYLSEISHFYCFRLINYLSKQQNFRTDFVVMEHLSKLFAKTGNLNMIRFMKNKGFHIIPQTLVIAAKYGHNNVVNYLLNNGFCSNISEALLEACKNGRLSCVKLLFKKDKIEDGSLLAWAALNGHVQLMKYFKLENSEIDIGIYTKLRNSILTEKNVNGVKLDSDERSNSDENIFNSSKCIGKCKNMLIEWSSENDIEKTNVNINNNMETNTNILNKFHNVDHLLLDSTNEIMDLKDELNNTNQQIKLLKQDILDLALNDDDNNNNKIILLERKLSLFQWGIIIFGTGFLCKQFISNKGGTNYISGMFEPLKIQ